MSSAGIDIVAQMAPSSYATERPDGVRVCSPGAHTQGERGITSYIVLTVVGSFFTTIIVYGSATVAYKGIIAVSGQCALF